jgi:hypothetical protein
MHAPCMLAADSVGESLRAAASSQTACCVPVHAVGCMQGCMQGACSTGRRVKGCGSAALEACTAAGRRALLLCSPSSLASL